MDEVTSSPSEGQPLTSLSSWERAMSAFFQWAPYVLITIAAIFAQLTTETSSDRVRGLALSADAVMWTLLTFTRLGKPFRIPQAPLRLYLAGFLLISTLLVLTNTLFLVYAITGLFHASLLRPWPLAFTGIGAASAVVHAHIVITESTPTTWTIFAGVVAIQAVAVGAGIFGGQKLTEIAEERRLALEHFNATLEENEGLHRQLVAQAREAGMLDERQRMAREIHDTIAQGLAGVVTQIEAANQSLGDPDRLRRRLDTASEIARQSLAEARRSVEAIRPAPLDSSGLPEALGDVASKWSERSGVSVEVKVTGDQRPLHPEVEVALLRAAQEALANVAKHAAASRAGITLSFMDASVALDIRDDGRGMDIASPVNAQSFGLAAMRQRMEYLQGEVSLESSPGEGTAVSVRVPTTIGDSLNV